MSDFTRLRERTLKLVPDLLVIARERGASTAAERLARAATRLRDSEFTVVVCGEFKRGKSTLLNALLNEDPPLFPVDAIVATSLVTVAGWGETERITVTTQDGEQLPITRAEIADYATEHGNPGNRKEIRPLISITTPNAQLKSGVKLVDTPGVGGVLADHTAVTTSFLPSADAIIFVTDFTQPLTASELAFLSQAAEAAGVHGDIDGLIVVVTKADVLGAKERAESLANTVAKLADVTGQPAESWTVVPVSSRAKRRYQSTGDAQDLADSNFEELEAVLWPAVARRRARIVLSAALSDLDATVHALIEPLETELAGYVAETAQRLKEVKDEADSRQRKLNDLQSSRAEWRGRLRDELLRIGTELDYDIEAELKLLWQQANTRYLMDESYLGNPDQLVTRLGSDAALVATRITERVQQRAAEAVRFFSQTYGLDLPTPEVAELPAPLVPDLAVTKALEVPGPDDGRSWERVKEGFEGAGMGGSIGGTAGGLLGAIVGTVLFPGIGTYAGSMWGGIIGSAVGSVFGAVGSVRRVQATHRTADLEVRRKNIMAELEPLRLEQIRQMRADLDRIVKWLIEVTAAELDDKIERERESAADALNRLGEVAETTSRQADERRAQLDAELTPLREARAEIRELAAAAGRS